MELQRAFSVILKNKGNTDSSGKVAERVVEEVLLKVADTLGSDGDETYWMNILDSVDRPEQYSEILFHLCGGNWTANGVNTRRLIEFIRKDTVGNNLALYFVANVSMPSFSQWRSLLCLLQNNQLFLSTCSNNISTLIQSTLEVSFQMTDLHGDLGLTLDQRNMIECLLACSLVLSSSASAEDAADLLPTLFRCMDNLEPSKDVGEAAEDNTDWLERCRTITVSAIIALIRKSTHCPRPLPQADLLRGLASEAWQTQLLHMHILLKALDQATTSISSSTGANAAAKLMASSSKRNTTVGVALSASDPMGRRDTKKASIRPGQTMRENNKKRELTKGDVTGDISAVDQQQQQQEETTVMWWIAVGELCRLGVLRSLCWALLATNPVVRRHANQVLDELLIRLFEMKESASSSAGGTPSRRELNQLRVECVVSIIEQGLIPLLEHIAAGHVVTLSSSSDSQNFAGGGVVPSAMDCSLRDWQKWYWYESRRPQEVAEDISSSARASDFGEPLVGRVIFPEPFIRQTASSLLAFTASSIVINNGSTQDAKEVPSAVSGKGRKSQLAVESLQPTTAFSRLINSLLASGNTKLRTNIIVGVLHLGAVHPEVGRLLWNSAVPAEVPSLPSLPSFSVAVIPDEIQVVVPGGALFAHLLVGISKEGDGAGAVLVQVVLKPLLALFSATLTDMSENSSNSTSEPSSESISTSLSPTIAVAASNELLRMQCPSLPLLFKHSPRLTQVMEEELKHQLLNCGEILAKERCEPFDPAVHVDGIDGVTLLRCLSKVPINEFCVCSGPYGAWQEIFSHMQDTFLLTSSLQRMQLVEIIQCYILSRAWGMEALTAAYTSTLIDRINAVDIGLVFQAALGCLHINSSSINLATMQQATATAVGRNSSSKIAASLKASRPSMTVATNVSATASQHKVLSEHNHRPHLQLVCACLRYLSSHMEQFIKLSEAHQVLHVLQMIHRCLSLCLIEE